MIVAVPSNHEAVADAFAAAGLGVVHVDQHIREHLIALDPLVNSQGVMANRESGGRLSMKLDERRSQVHSRARRMRWDVTDIDEFCVRVTKIERYGGRTEEHHDLFGELVERNPELRRMVSSLRNLLTAPDFTALDGETVIVGVDTDLQAATLPDDMKVVALAGLVPPWAVDANLTVIHGADTGNETNGVGADLVAQIRLVPV